MSLRSKLREAVEIYRPLREAKYFFLPPLSKLRYNLASDERERDIVANGHRPVLECPDSDLIPRVPDAGKIKNGALIMHNGVKILPSSYFGYPILRMLMNTRGVHEPQEERVFAEVLKRMPSGATMIELVHYWAFYSIWFANTVPNANNFLVEPILSNYYYGQKNFSLNNRKGHFTRAYVGQTSGVVDGVKRICIDDFVAENNIKHIDILHCDIQGFEADMLRGAEKTINAGRVDYAFISTHSNDLHRECETFLRDHNYEIIASVDLDDVYGPDGVVVGRLKTVEGVGPIAVSLKSQTKPTPAVAG